MLGKNKKNKPLIYLGLGYLLYLWLKSSNAGGAVPGDGDGSTTGSDEPSSLLSSNNKGKAWRVKWNADSGTLYGYMSPEDIKKNQPIDTFSQEAPKIQVQRGEELGYVDRYSTSQFGKLKGWVKVRMNIVDRRSNREVSLLRFYPYNFAKGASNIITIEPI